MTVPEKPPAKREGVACCSYCWKAYSVKGRPAGTRFNCTSCGQPVTVGAGDEKKKKKRPSRAPAKEEAFHEAETMVMEAAEAPASPDPVAAAERAEQRKELDTAKAELIQTRKAYQQTKAHADKAKVDVARLTTDLRDKDEEAAAAAATIDELETKRDGLDKESQRLCAQLASTTSTSAEQAGKIKELDESLRQREETVEQQSARIEQQSSRIAEIEKELSTRVTMEETETFHAEKRELNERVDSAARKVASFREALKGLFNPAKELVRRFEEMESQTGETGLPDFTQELDKAREEAQANKGEADSLRAEGESLREEIQSLKREIGEREALIVAKAEEIARRDERIEELTRPPDEQAPPPGFFGAIAKKTKGLFGGKKKAEGKPERPSARKRRKKEQEPEEVEELEEIPEIEPEEAPPPKATSDELPTDKHSKVRPRRTRRKKKQQR